MKFIIIALMLFVTISAYPKDGNVCYPDSPHNLTAGNCDSEKMIMIKDITTNPSEERYINIPWDGTSFEKPIKCLKITDRVLNNEGGCPSIKWGGIGQKYVTIHWLPQKGKKMLFNIKVFKDKEE